MTLSSTTAMFTNHRGKDVFAGVDLLARAGFTSLDVGLHRMVGEGGLLAGDDWENNITALSAHIRALGMRPTQAHAAFLSALQPWYADDAARNAYLSILDRCVRAACVLGVKWLVVHPVCAKNTEGMSFQAAIDVNCRFFEGFTALCGKCGVGLAFENLFVGEFTSADALYTLFEAFKGAPFGLCWDTGHAHITGQDQRASILRMGGALKCTHIHDNSSKADEHLTPYYGSVNWQEIARALAEIAYKGDFTLEVETRALPCELYAEFARYAHAAGTRAMQEAP